ncbi:MAG TPA: hypothetical protein VNP04_26465 [Alphaproteobacteria bacterium]|nr:hypothetical protein [Alphaproteobacteria bacterium]
MKRLVAAGDRVVVTSDHGFVELEDQHGITIDAAQTETQVFYRRLRTREDSGTRPRGRAQLYRTIEG